MLQEEHSLLFRICRATASAKNALSPHSDPTSFSRGFGNPVRASASRSRAPSFRPIRRLAERCTPLTKHSPSHTVAFLRGNVPRREIQHSSMITPNSTMNQRCPFLELSSPFKTVSPLHSRIDRVQSPENPTSDPAGSNLSCDHLSTS